MRTIDTMAWSETLGVHPMFLSSAMREKLKRMESSAEDLRALLISLKDAPDDELVVCLQSANRSMEQAMRAIELAMRQVGR